VTSFPPSRIDLKQARTIARATIDGFLQSDLMPSGMQAPALIWAAAFLVGPALFFPAQFLAKYPFLRRYYPFKVEGALWDDRLLFLLLSASAMGIVAVVLWDTIFPARRDAFVLTPLPVPVTVQMAGRLGGLGTLCVAFIVALNAVPAFMFPIVASASLKEMPRAMAAHFVSAAAADAFVFFGIASLQGIVILAFGRRAAVRLAPVAQAGTILVLLLALLLMNPARAFTTGAIQRGDLSAPGLLLFPPSWFLGLYEFLAGTQRPMMTVLAYRATLAAAVPIAATIAIYAMGYRRLLARAVETPPQTARSPLRRLASSGIRAMFVRRSEEQAVCSFVIRAIARSRRHSMLMSIYVGGGLALIVTTIIPDLVRLGASALAQPRVSTLAAPLMLSAALAVGVRILITIPAEMPARWVFQTTGLAPRRMDAATHKAMLLLVLPSVMVTAGLSAWVLWGPRIAMMHTAFCGVLTLALCEALLIGYRGVPLTRPYVPGRSAFHIAWPAYLVGFFLYTYEMAELERDLLPAPRALAIAVAVFGAIAAILWLRRKYKVAHWDDVPFEAEMPSSQMFQGFNLSEGYTAQAVASTRRLDGGEQEIKSFSATLS